MKKLILIFVCVCICFFSSSGQTDDETKKESPYSFSVTVASLHYWRGIEITGMPTLMMYSKFKLNKSGTLYFGFWGASAFSEEREKNTTRQYRELDLYIAYENKGFYIALWDLFNPTPLVRDKNILNYRARSTAHILDLRTSYTFQNSFPLRIEFDVLLYGDDLPVGTSDERNALSSYLELSYPFIRDSDVNVSGLVASGFSLNGKDENIYGGGAFEIVNVGLVANKTVKITENFEIPVKASVLINPATQFGRLQLLMTILE